MFYSNSNSFALDKGFKKTGETYNLVEEMCNAIVEQVYLICKGDYLQFKTIKKKLK